MDEMDKNMKCLVASNLTIAFCANQPVPITVDLIKNTPPPDPTQPPKPIPMSESRVLEVYRYFLELVDPPRTERES
ncbi:MAG TPA: hypothetical protein VHE60_08380 [Pyrinomonadaceae bacterium]|nr:hypothetical protein [Pyrinomonadaceae bacterium]